MTVRVTVALLHTSLVSMSFGSSSGGSFSDEPTLQPSFRRRGRAESDSQFLQRMATEGPSTAEDDYRISRFPAHAHEQPVPEIPIPLRPDNINRSWVKSVQEVFDEFYATGNAGRPVKRYTTMEEGLQKEGWHLVPRDEEKVVWVNEGSRRLSPSGATLGAGGFGSVRMAYKQTEVRTPLEARHLAAVKVQPHHNVIIEWDYLEEIRVEINVLRGCVHRNIIGYHDHFCVGEQDGRYYDLISVVILLEYASAGDMYKEISRFKDGHMNEACARYYTRQMCNGLQYLHSKFVLHNDLTSANVLLKYNRDGSKTCMLADFGKSLVFDPLKGRDGHAGFAAPEDILGLARIVFHMCYGEHNVAHTEQGRKKASDELRDLIDAHQRHKHGGGPWPTTVHQLRHQFSWFKGPMEVPFPRPPTPLYGLKPDIVQGIGYAPTAMPAPGWSAQEIARRTAGLSDPDARSRSGSSSSASSTDAAPVQLSRLAISNLRHARTRVTAAPAATAQQPLAQAAPTQAAQTQAARKPRRSRVAAFLRHPDQ